jgi:protein Tex
MMHSDQISRELKISQRQVQEVARLLDEGATIPFIARYRKEVTGSLDEVVITKIRDRIEQLTELDQRREAILKSVEERGLLTDELRQKILEANTMAVLEDIYLPYRPKRRTRATIAREKGLEPLARIIFDQTNADITVAAAKFLAPDNGVETIEDALAGARDIIAEWINEDEIVRSKIRRLFISKSRIRSRVVSGKEEEGSKYRDYFEWEEPATTAPSHRVLAMFRGEQEGYLKVHLLPSEEEAMEQVESVVVRGSSAASGQVSQAARDAYKRLLASSMETEFERSIRIRADAEAIRVFAENLRQLLLAPPLGQKNVLAIDPGFRTGCKVVCLDQQGKLLHNETIFLLSESGTENAGKTMIHLCERYNIEAIAIGNGTASRETESFIRKLKLPDRILIVMVNESGASVYSASDVAREEFPDQDVTVRGAVSIGRRLIDPLAELVKIEPKAIGVGQYQHDVDQTVLKRSLDDVVMSCVNGVGVEVNTASKELLTYVSGLGPQLARNIVRYRNENGPFRSRAEFRRVPKIGPKAFEQSAGFLRIRGGSNPLDASAVHPERYQIVDKMATDLQCSVPDLLENEELRNRINIQQYIAADVGEPTLRDILEELSKPGRDPREHFETFQFAEGVEKMEDVKPGMKLPGIVTNITAFGAFVDIGVHQDGLVHISQLSNRFIKDPNEIVKLHQKVTVTVLEVDLQRKRISLTMK